MSHSLPFTSPEGVRYRMWEALDREILRRMIQDFYAESPEGKPMSPTKIQATFEQLQAHPSIGTFLLLEKDGQCLGYALLINFWSNEYGGIILVIDELYILPPFRNQGLGKAFLRFLSESRFNQCIALELEVLPYNNRALRLYEQLGFRKSDRSYLLWEKETEES